MSKDKNTVQVKGTMDVTIKYSQSECLELSKSLNGKKEKITALKDELKETKAEINSQIKAMEKEIDSDLDTLANERRHIPNAEIIASLDKETGVVEIKHHDQVVSREKYNPQKHKGLFGEMVNAAMEKKESA